MQLRRRQLRRRFRLDPSCVLYLPLYELDGNSFQSKDRYGHLATVTGATWTPRGRKFDGTDDRIIVPNSAPLQITPAITYEFWVNQSVLKDTAVFLSNNVAGVPNVLIRSTNGGFYAVLQSANSQALTIINEASHFTAGAWYHIVVTVSSGVGIAYKNGVQVGTATNALMNSIAMTTQFEIGRDSREVDYLNGYIGEVRIYNRALTVSEILRIYQATRFRYQ